MAGSVMKAIICGAGIGGLTTALHLHRAGMGAEVFESVPEIRPLGVGINLLPHAVRELTLLGLQDRLAEIAIPTAELVYFSKFGRQIWSEPRGLAAGYKWPQFSIHRGRLQMLLFDEVSKRLGSDRLHVGHHLSSFACGESSVTAHFSDRQTGESKGSVTGDVLIGAEGIHSTVRRYFYPDEGAPPFSGRYLFRGVTEAAPFLTGRSMIMAGYPDCKFVAYPICPETAARGRSLINWIADVRTDARMPGDQAPPVRDWNRRIDKSVFGSLFETWKFDWLDVPALIDGATEIFEYPLVDRDPLPRWSFDRVTLLGDAAHPMYPIGSNGASQAILDAAAVTHALASGSNVTEALRVYESVRLEPTSKIVLANRQQGPEACMQLVEERAPNGFGRLEDVISMAELEEIATRYKAVAGFDRDRLNAMSTV